MDFGVFWCGGLVHQPERTARVKPASIGASITSNEPLVLKYVYVRKKLLYHKQI